ncbi:aspartyl-phosphate phosphatase Spo0E family protein [Clostridium sp. YIM B02551]|uniref:aspartyl-phosphate phosphatase Spo0E family protein n=1 Tax=Clostridium sp. YIM B02551 TaxID=2910679 RepID=UPI001EEB3705|nr:aspartyl-phosphate phosphatase Spo0E family protein [Clostridium sp. YIM B02551]
MDKNSCEDCKDADVIEKLRLTLYKHWDSIIQNNITKEILLISEELDKLIVNYYQKETSDTEMR